MSWLDTQPLRVGKDNQAKDPAQRNKQMNEELAEAISAWFASEYEPPLGVLLTVIHASMDRDLEHARIEISVIPESAGKALVKSLKSQTSKARHFLSRRHPNWRYHPKIHFFLTEEVVKDMAVQNILDRLAKEEKTKTDQSVD